MHLPLAVLVHLHCQLDAILLVVLQQIRAAPVSDKTWQLQREAVCGDMTAWSCSHAALCAHAAQGVCKKVLQNCFTVSVFGIQILTTAVALTVHAAQVASLQTFLRHAHHKFTSAPCMTNMHGPGR